MTQPSELKPAKTTEQIIKTYKKANKNYKAKLLKLYGVKDINRLLEIKTPKSSTIKCSSYELARVLMNHPHTNLKVSFQKQVKEKDVFNEIMLSYNNSTPVTFEKELKKAIKTALNGETREMNGFHNKKLDSVNRLYFTCIDEERDTTKGYDNRMKLISLSHLNWIEVNGTKFMLK